MIVNAGAVEVVHQIKYMGIVLDDKLTFDMYVNSLCKQTHQRMYFHWMLSDFNVDYTFMRMFY